MNVAADRGLDYESAAHYVLAHVGYTGQWLSPGSFYEALVDAAFRADQMNLARLHLVFPNVVEAVTVYREQGPEVLARSTETKENK